MAHEAVQANNDTFTEAARNKDAKSIAGCYTQDCVLLPNGAPRMEGPAAVESFFSQAFDSGIERIELTTSDVNEAGDRLIEIGHAAVTISPPGADSIEDGGDYVVVYRQEEGAWKMAIDIWNTDTPPPGMGG